MWVPVAVWQPCELLYSVYLFTFTPMDRPLAVVFRGSGRPTGKMLPTASAALDQG